MRRVRLGVVNLCMLISISGCRAPSPDWNGTWKLNPTKSSYQGQVLTISVLADGEYRFEEKSSHTLRCDGRDQPLGNKRELLCIKSGIAALDIVIRVDGIKTRATHDELSADGKVFTTTVTEFRANGPVITSQVIFSRLSGSDGFAGQWRDMSYLQQHADMTMRLETQALHIEYPSVSQQIDAPLNGVDSTVRGPHVLDGTTFAVRPLGDREFVMVTKRNGEVFARGSLKLSKDGESITESWSNPDHPDDKGTLVYYKK